MVEGARFSLDASSPAGWASVQAVMDAIDAGQLRPDDRIFDAEFQRWNRVADHPELGPALAERLRFRPAADADRLQFPSLTPDGSTPIRLRAVSREVAAARSAAAQAVPVDVLPVAPAAVPPLAKPLGTKHGRNSASAERVTSWYGMGAVAAVLAILGWGVLQLVKAVSEAMSSGVRPSN